MKTNAKPVFQIKLDKNNQITIGSWKSKAIPFFPVNLKGKDKSQAFINEILFFNKDKITELDGKSIIKEHNLLSSNNLLSSILDENGESYKNLGKIKEANQLISKYIGPNFINSYRRALFSAWVGKEGENGKAIKSTAYNYNFLRIIGSQPYLAVFHRMKKEIDKAIEDGIENICPFIVTFDMTPKELKSYLGKSAWKKLCKFSLGKNKMISYLIRMVRDKQEINDDDGIFLNKNLFYSYILKNKNTDIKLVNHCLDWNLTYIKMILDEGTINNNLNLDALGWVYKNLNDSITKYKPRSFMDVALRVEKRKREYNPNILIMLHYFIDTYWMAKTNNQRFNLNWSALRMKVEHDKLAEIDLVNLSKEEGVKFNLSHLGADFPVKFTFNHKGEEVLVNVLQDSFNLTLEGLKMKHCIASYQGKIMNKEYIAFSLISPASGYRSTLGLALSTHSNKVYFNQHYSRFNEAVKNEAHIKAAENTLEKLNSTYISS